MVVYSPVPVRCLHCIDDQLGPCASRQASKLLHRKHPEEYTADWKREHKERLAQLTEGVQSDKFTSVQADLEPQGPILRDGFFEANVSICHMYPVYWQDPPRALLRGTWFVEAGGLKRVLLPLPHAAASVLERAWQSGCVPQPSHHSAPHTRTRFAQANTAPACCSGQRIE